jgi:hypothetical protein
MTPCNALEPGDASMKRYRWLLLLMLLLIRLAPPGTETSQGAPPAATAFVASASLSRVRSQSPGIVQSASMLLDNPRWGDG